VDGAHRARGHRHVHRPQRRARRADVLGSEGAGGLALLRARAGMGRADGDCDVVGGPAPRHRPPVRRTPARRGAGRGRQALAEGAEPGHPAGRGSTDRRGHRRPSRVRLPGGQGRVVPPALPQQAAFRSGLPGDHPVRRGGTGLAGGRRPLEADRRRRGVRRAGMPRHARPGGRGTAGGGPRAGPGGAGSVSRYSLARPARTRPRPAHRVGRHDSRPPGQADRVDRRPAAGHGHATVATSPSHRPRRRRVGAAGADRRRDPWWRPGRGGAVADLDSGGLRGRVRMHDRGPGAGSPGQGRPRGDRPLLPAGPGPVPARVPPPRPTGPSRW
jgi:hypothetical protein